MLGKRKDSILEVNTLFLFSCILLLTVGTIVQRQNIWSGSLITETLLILAPSLLYIKLNRESYKEVLKLNKISFKNIIIVIIISIFIYPVAIFFQAIFITLIRNFIDIIPNGVPVPTNLIDYLKSVAIIAVTPGICEEIMFRGVMLNSYRDLKSIKSIFITAFLFAIMHFNLLNFIGPFILGIVYGIMIYRTNSIYTTMLAHFINNTIALSLGYITELKSDYIEYFLMWNFDAPKIFLYSLIFIVISFFIVIFMIDKLTFSEYEKQADEIDEIKEEEYDPYPHGLLIEYGPVFIALMLFIHVNVNYVLI